MDNQKFALDYVEPQVVEFGNCDTVTQDPPRRGRACYGKNIQNEADTHDLQY